ncbi:hypothetical protein [Streptomyces stelliscabiei]|uniref:hypothetical protein n=1 Tax=Streptomyces stelliscabiei TaxID=146820 RepID=UPI002FF2A404
MARLQILELPEGTGGDRPPFILVVDQALPERHVIVSGEIRVRSEWDTLAETIGARGVIVTPETIDIPANDTTAYLNAAANGSLPADARYEMVIGGKPVDWPRADELSARTVDAVEAEEKLKAHEIRQRVDRECRAALTDALGMDGARDWDDIRNAARGLRAERDARTAIVQRVRDFPNTPESADSPAAIAPEYLAGYRDAVDAVRRATYSADAHTDA